MTEQFGIFILQSQNHTYWAVRIKRPRQHNLWCHFWVLYFKILLPLEWGVYTRTIWYVVSAFLTMTYWQTHSVLNVFPQKRPLWSSHILTHLSLSRILTKLGHIFESQPFRRPMNALRWFWFCPHSNHSNYSFPFSNGLFYSFLTHLQPVLNDSFSRQKKENKILFSPLKWTSFIVKKISFKKTKSCFLSFSIALQVLLQLTMPQRPRGKSLLGENSIPVIWRW